jgi:hypothetical protein
MRQNIKEVIRVRPRQPMWSGTAAAGQQLHGLILLSDPASHHDTTYGTRVLRTRAIKEPSVGYMLL